MKRRKPIVLGLALCFIIMSINVSALQQINDDRIEMVEGYKLKTKVDKNLKLNAEAKIDEQENSGSVSVGISTEYGSVLKYCKPRRRKQCPKKYL